MIIMLTPNDLVRKLTFTRPNKVYLLFKIKKLYLYIEEKELEKGNHIFYYHDDNENVFNIIHFIESLPRMKFTYLPF